MANQEQRRLWHWLPDITQSVPRDILSASVRPYAAESVILPDWPDDGNSWQDELLKLLKEIDPYQFEKLVKELLTAAGMENVTITQRSRDDGIDGSGWLVLAGMMKVPAHFQCKRYGDRVGVKEVRDFRGALEGRSNLGLLVTTGDFTEAALAEAARPGGVIITPVNGYQLCGHLKEYNLGIVSTTGTAEIVTVDHNWFRNL